jgi:hypothetical protein
VQVLRVQGRIVIVGAPKTVRIEDDRPETAAAQ